MFSLFAALQHKTGCVLLLPRVRSRGKYLAVEPFADGDCSLPQG